MFSVVERLALGHCDVADKLREVLRLFRSKSRLSGGQENVCICITEAKIRCTPLIRTGLLPLMPPTVGAQ